MSEKLIQQRMSHRSIEVLSQYEHTSAAQLLDVSNVMSSVTDSDSHSTVQLDLKLSRTYACAIACTQHEYRNIHCVLHVHQRLMMYIHMNCLCRVKNNRDEGTQAYSTRIIHKQDTCVRICLAHNRLA